MRFRLTADAILEADDLNGALRLLADHFGALCSTVDVEYQGTAFVSGGVGLEPEEPARDPVRDPATIPRTRRWVQCSELLPPEHTPVLIYIQWMNNALFAWRVGMEWKTPHDIPRFEVGGAGGPSHWMSLPEAPATITRA